MPLPPGLCETWTPVWSCALPTGSYAVSGVALQMASETLYALSGRQFGLCTETVRPCRRDCYGDTWPLGWTEYGYPHPALIGGRWFNLGCATCTSGCSCASVSEALLPGPVYDVVQVKVDGIVLVTGAYRVDDNRVLVRLDGDEWPVCNDLSLPDTEVGTWSVTLRRGVPVPPLGEVAAGILAREYMNLLLCSEECGLPQQVQSISRQGVNITYLDPNEVFQNGRTGLYVPDIFIQTYNPDGHRSPAKVYDIDNPDLGRRINTG